MDSVSAAKTSKISFKKFKKSATLKNSKPGPGFTSLAETNPTSTEQISNNILQDERWNDQSADTITSNDNYGASSHPSKKAKFVGVDSKALAEEKAKNASKDINSAIELDSNLEQKRGLRADENRISKIAEKLNSTLSADSTPAINKLENHEERPCEYRGMSSYRSFAPQLQGEQSTLPKKTGQKSKFGPMRASQSIRVTSVIDYQPDVCKDYKETGFCGYGDSCKFLHDRGVYKTGWQLEEEWEKQQANGGRIEDRSTFKLDDSESEASEEEELPFACPICRSEFKKPITTKCGHYFCEPCALKNYSKTPKCFICGAPTSGLFKPAANLVKKLKEKHSRLESEA